ncbi:hypothetical protein B0H63DRAFT_1474 [Podospora didyma]|uniref:Secreted protein n=1 Tax=Podospora didyma TaxID=330526 RepID=A0AAE0P3K2_9PEZI|nr:hypothetical protein B0H63DRAFT_1474 [Podospora didyma]
MAAFGNLKLLKARLLLFSMLVRRSSPSSHVLHCVWEGSALSAVAYTFDRPISVSAVLRPECDGLSAFRPA